MDPPARGDLLNSSTAEQSALRPLDSGTCLSLRALQLCRMLPSVSRQLAARSATRRTLRCSAGERRACFQAPDRLMDARSVFGRAAAVGFVAVSAEGERGRRQGRRGAAPTGQRDFVCLRALGSVCASPSHSRGQCGGLSLLAESLYGDATHTQTCTQSRTPSPTYVQSHTHTHV